MATAQLWRPLARPLYRHLTGSVPVTSTGSATLGAVTSTASGDVPWVLDLTSSLPSTLTFARTSLAWHYDSTGTLVSAPHNLVLQSQTFDNASWGKTRTSVVADTAAAPDGTTTADGLYDDTGTGTHSLGQTISFVAGATYTLSCYGKYTGSRSSLQLQLPSAAFGGTDQRVRFDLSPGSYVSVTGTATATITSAGNSWWRCTITATATTTASSGVALFVSDSSVSYTGTGAGNILIWGAQCEMHGSARSYRVTTTAADHGPRFDHVYDTNLSAWRPAGLLVEEARTNSVQNSAMVGAGTGVWPTGWVISTAIAGLTVNVSTATENGLACIDIAVSGTPGATGSIVAQYATTAMVPASNGQTWTSSLFAKLQSGVLTGMAPIISVSERDGGGVALATTTTSLTPTSAAITTQRSAATRTFNNASTVALESSFRINVTNGVAVTGGTIRIAAPMVELGGFMTSPVITYGSATTRALDTCYTTSLPSGVSTTAFTVTAEFSRLNTATAGLVSAIGRVWDFSDGGTSNAVGLYHTAGTPTTLSYNVTGTQMNITASTMAASVGIRSAMALASGDQGCCVWGGAVTTGTLTPPNLNLMNRLDIGNRSDGLRPWNGHIRLVQINPRRETNFQIQVLSSLEFDFLRGSADSRLSVSRSGATATRINASGLVETVAANAARIDYDPTTLACKGLLIEAGVTNLCLRSAEFSDATWTKADLTATADQTTSPDGTANADAVVETATTATHAISQTVSLVTGSTYTFSVYYKSIGGSRWLAVNVNNLGAFAHFGPSGEVGATSATAGYTLVGSGVSAVGNGWYRAYIAVTHTGTITSAQVRFKQSNGGSSSYAGDTGHGAYLWGAQVETNFYASSYVATAGSTVARNSDIVTLPDVSGVYSATAGTLNAEFDFTGVGTAEQAVLSLEDGTNNERYVLRLNSQVMGGVIVDGGVTQAAMPPSGSPTSAANTLYKGAMAWASNDAVYVQGGTVGTSDTSVTLPTPTKIQFGGRLGTGGQALQGHVRKARYGASRWTNANMQTLTQT